MQTELKPCPFCGGEAILIKDFKEGEALHHPSVVVKCDTCGCNTGHYIVGCYGMGATMRDVINAWNRRV